MRYIPWWALFLGSCLVPRTVDSLQRSVAQEDFTAAQATLDVALEKKPRNRKLHVHQQFLNTLLDAQSALESHETAAALALYVRAEGLVSDQPFVASQQAHAAALLDAEEAMLAEKWNHARNALRRARSARPHSDQVPRYEQQIDTVVRASRLMKHERWDGAAEEMASLTDFPLADFGQIQQLLIAELRIVSARLDAEQWEDARAALARAQEVKATPEVARFSLHISSMADADAAMAERRWEAAVTHLEEAQGSRPGRKYVSARQSLAVPMHTAHTQMKNEQYADAVTSLEAATRVAPDDGEIQAWLRYARSMHEATNARSSRDWKTAERQYLEAQRARPSDVTVARQLTFVRAMSEGDGHLKRLRWSKAHTAYAEALKMRPGDLYASNQEAFCGFVVAGLTREAEEDWKGALAEYKKADRVQSGHPFVVAHMERVQTAAVRGALDKALSEGESGAFRVAFNELDFALENGAQPNDADPVRDTLERLIREDIDRRVYARQIEVGYKRVSLARAKLGDRTWIAGDFARLRTAQLEEGWALVRRDQYQRGIDALALIVRFEPDQAPKVRDEGLRMRVAWADDLTAEGLRTRDYQRAIDALHSVLGAEPDLRREHDQRDGELRTAWATDVRKVAVTHQRARRFGAAAATYARAVEIAEKAEDQAALTALLERLRAEGPLDVRVETEGASQRTEPLRLQVHDALREIEGVHLSENKYGNHVTVHATVNRHTCSITEAPTSLEVRDADTGVVSTEEATEFTRTCEVTLDVEVTGSGVRASKALRGSGATSAIAENGQRAGSPPAMPRSDDALVSEIDRELGKELREIVVEEVSNAWRERLREAFDQTRRDADTHIGTLLGRVHTRPDLLTQKQWRVLEELLEERYGLLDTRRLLPAH